LYNFIEEDFTMPRTVNRSSCTWVALLVVGCMMAWNASASGEPAPGQDLAELPSWPHGLFLPGGPPPKPDKTSGRIRAQVLAWAPPEAKRIRSLLVVPNNTDSIGFAAHPATRVVAVKREMGMVYLREGDVAHVQDVLNAVAAKTGIVEFKHAPWIVYGKSSRGMFPIQMEWKFPKRTIAGISFHAETPTWPPGAEANLGGETLLHVIANGEMEWGGTWYVHVRPSLLNYRAQKNWLPHQVVSWGVGHGDYPDETSGRDNPAPRQTRRAVWDYLALYVDKVLGLRVPQDKYPTDGPLDLKQVDEAAGYVIDPFAVEDLFRKPRCPLISSPAGYIVVQEPSGGYAAIAPPKDYAAPEGVPVTPLASGKSPTGWLITPFLPFAMKNDPMVDLGGLVTLRPKPGDAVKVDDHDATFNPIAPNGVARNGGINVKRGTFTVLAFTVLEVDKTQHVKLKASYSAAGRLQVVLNGVPVAHTQVIELQKGQYPMLVVLRKMGVAGTDWSSIQPLFTEIAQEEAERTKLSAAEDAKRKAELSKRLAERPKAPLIRKAGDVPKDERAKMFWVADREQAEAWFKLHALHGQKME
jgi:hypothetical protein